MFCSYFFQSEKNCLNLEHDIIMLNSFLLCLINNQSNPNTKWNERVKVYWSLERKHPFAADRTEGKKRILLRMLWRQGNALERGKCIKGTAPEPILPEKHNQG